MADISRKQAVGAWNDENAKTRGSQGNRTAQNSGFFIVLALILVHCLFEISYN